MVELKELHGVSTDDIRAELHARHKAGSAQAKGFSPASKLAAVGTKSLVKQLQSDEKAIYGVDDRKDFYDFPDDAVRERSRGVAALFRDSDIASNADGTVTLTTERLGTAMNLCSSERFANQQAGAFCSGFLVGSNMIATAGHCATSEDVTTVRFVFGFRMSDATTAVTRIPKTDVYAGKSIVGRVRESSGADWALVELDRPVAGRPILPIRRSGRIANNSPVSVMGHPSGLPLKFAAGSNVRDNTPSAFFVANLDTYGGNSGSPVFAADGTVEGILVRGEVDYVSNGDCLVSKVCPSTGCRGEDCTRITELADKVP